MLTSKCLLAQLRILSINFLSSFFRFGTGQIIWNFWFLMFGFCIDLIHLLETMVSKLCRLCLKGRRSRFHRDDVSKQDFHTQVVLGGDNIDQPLPFNSQYFFDFVALIVFFFHTLIFISQIVLVSII